uniref:Putative secreted protein n=1 Tax=Anopheles marajoara TaxID=58244 RepID=A0A2M4CC66_9DIPT
MRWLLGRLIWARFCSAPPVQRSFRVQPTPSTRSLKPLSMHKWLAPETGYWLRAIYHDYMPWVSLSVPVRSVVVCCTLV